MRCQVRLIINRANLRPRPLSFSPLPRRAGGSFQAAVADRRSAAPSFRSSRAPLPSSHTAASSRASAGTAIASTPAPHTRHGCTQWLYATGGEHQTGPTLSAFQRRGASDSARGAGDHQQCRTKFTTQPRATQRERPHAMRQQRWSVALSCQRVAAADISSSARQDDPPFTGHSPEQERPLGGVRRTDGDLRGALRSLRYVAARVRARAAWHDRDPRSRFDAIATHKSARLIARDRVTSTVRAPFTTFQDDAGHGEVDEAARGQRTAASDRRAPDLPVLPQHLAGRRLHPRPRGGAAFDTVDRFDVRRANRRRRAADRLRQG
jgi:hypothetical protein